MKKIKLFLEAWWPALVWMGVIFYLSSLPAEEVLISKTDWVERNLKNILHAIEYGILWLFVYRGESRFNANNKPSYLIIWTVSILFALSDEYHQMYTPGREASWGDIGFDVLGMAIASLVVVKNKINLK